MPELATSSFLFVDWVKANLPSKARSGLSFVDMAKPCHFQPLHLAIAVHRAGLQLGESRR